ncbi:Peptidase M23 [Thalassoporum mexicanum PCC 7367]|nr:Peptidase M23 [Pseudanabaena sp. PCC 7367]
MLNAIAMKFGFPSWPQLTNHRHLDSQDLERGSMGGGLSLLKIFDRFRLLKVTIAAAGICVFQFTFTSLVICSLLVSGLAIGFAPGMAYAQSVEDLQNYQKLVEQQKQLIDLQQYQINAISRPAQERLEALQRNVFATDQQINNNLGKLKQAEAQLQDLEADLSYLEIELSSKRITTIARLQHLQRQKLDHWWALLLSSRDLNQFASRRHQIGRIYEGDRQLLGQIKQKSDKLETKRQQVAKAKNEIILLNQKLAYQKANFQAEAEAQLNIVRRLNSDRVALELAEDRLAQDSRKIALLILSKTQSPQNMILIPGTGQMMYPTIGPISSTYGYRVHPILGYEKFHAGIDFAADYGTLIYAADSGTVIFAGWYGGYGNAVVVSHGNGITTLYAHTEEIYVKEGQAVQKGQPIAAVGSTGYSTGPHLHFEVRANGEPTDPAAFL